MKTIEYKNLEWYIIKETDKEKLLFLKDCLVGKLMDRCFFDRSMCTKSYDVRFSREDDPWWRYSYIRKVLNSTFLDCLDVNDLNKMKTVVSAGRPRLIVTTNDYVRLITKEEAEELPKEILKTDREFGYWTMSTSGYSLDFNSVFTISGTSHSRFGKNGEISHDIPEGTHGIRPVISLKSEEEKLKEKESQELILKLGHNLDF